MQNEVIAASPAIASIPQTLMRALPTLKKSVHVSHHGAPIIGAMLLFFDGRTIAARTTDLDVETVFRYDVCEPVGSATPFTAAIPFASFERATRKASNVTVSVDGDNATVDADGAVTTIALLPAADFPAPARTRFGTVLHTATVPLASCAAAFRKAVKAAAVDPARGATLGGVFLEMGAAPTTLRGAAARTGITMTATDGYRLLQTFVSATILSEVQDDNERGVIVPRGLADLVGSLKSSKADANAVAQNAVSKTHIRLAVNGYTITARLVDGRYPNYRQVMPSPCIDDSFLVDRKTLLDTARAATRVAGDRAKLITLSQHALRLTIEASSDELGRYTKSLSIESKRDSFKVAFNGAYFADLLGLIDADRVVIEQAAPLTPATMFAADRDPDTLVLLMPLRT